MKIAELICDLNCGHILAEHFVEYIFLVIRKIYTLQFAVQIGPNCRSQIQ